MPPVSRDTVARGVYVNGRRPAGQMDWRSGGQDSRSEQNMAPLRIIQRQRQKTTNQKTRKPSKCPVSYKSKTTKKKQTKEHR